MPEIRLACGHVTLVDQIDFERFGHLKWHFKGGYAVRHVPRPSHKVILLHNAIMGMEPLGLVDHINRQRLDNRRSNLRITTRSGNHQNTPRRNNRSKFHGVSLARNKWQARLCSEYLGIFETPEEAALVYNARAIARYGPHAYLNSVSVDRVEELLAIRSASELQKQEVSVPVAEDPATGLVPELQSEMDSAS